MLKSPQSIYFFPLHYTKLHSICTRSHATPFTHFFITLTHLSCHTTCSSQITHFHSTHSLIHTSAMEEYFSLTMDTFLPLKILAGDPMTLLLSFFQRPSPNFSQYSHLAFFSYMHHKIHPPLAMSLLTKLGFFTIEYLIYH